MKRRVINNILSKLPLVPHILAFKSDEDDLLYNPKSVHVALSSLKIISTYQESTVNVCEEILLAPFKPVGVVCFTVVGSTDIVLAVCSPKCIHCGDRSPMLQA